MGTLMETCCDFVKQKQIRFIFWLKAKKFNNLSRTSIQLECCSLPIIKRTRWERLNNSSFPPHTCPQQILINSKQMFYHLTMWMWIALQSQFNYICELIIFWNFHIYSCYLSDSVEAVFAGEVKVTTICFEGLPLCLSISKKKGWAGHGRS